MQIEAIAVNDNNGDDCYQMHNLEFTNGELTNQTNNGLLWRDTSIKLKYDGYDINDFAVGDRFTLSNFSISLYSGLNGPANNESIPIPLLPTNPPTDVAPVTSFKTDFSTFFILSSIKLIITSKKLV